MANAVHFKSNWLHKFNDAVDEPFFVTPCNKVNVKMMKLIRDLMYYYDDELKYAALELPYEVSSLNFNKLNKTTCFDRVLCILNFIIRAMNLR